MGSRSTCSWGALALVGLLLLTGCAGAGRNSEVVPTALPGKRFPTVVGIDLDGNEVTLPSGFNGKRNLIIVAFQRQQQGDAETWLGLYDSIRSDHPELQVYELPTIGRSGAIRRLWVNNGMRFGISGEEARARVITLYLDREVFQRALAIPTRDKIHVFLLNGAGNVVWRSDGPVTESTRADLAAALGG